MPTWRLRSRFSMHEPSHPPYQPSVGGAEAVDPLIDYAKEQVLRCPAREPQRATFRARPRAHHPQVDPASPHASAAKARILQSSRSAVTLLDLADLVRENREQGVEAGIRPVEPVLPLRHFARPVEPGRLENRADVLGREPLQL